MSTKKKIDQRPEDVLRKARERRKNAEAKRKSSGALHGQKLHASQREGYVRRWVNDKDGRIDQLQDMGYYFVSKNETDSDNAIITTDIGSAKSQIVDTISDPIRGYLMEIPEELHRENLRLKEENNRKQGEAYKHIERDAAKMATPQGRAEIYKPD